MNSYRTTSQAWRAVTRSVLATGRQCAPRGLPCRELLDHFFEVREPSSGAIETCDAKINERVAAYTRKEFELYASGSNSAFDFEQAAPFWGRIANPDGTVNSAYGHLLFKNRSCCGLTPWEWARESLLRDRDTRQAFLRFSLPEHQWLENKDQVCTMHGNFRIDEGCLDLTIVMRSNDVRRGLIYDMPWFCSLIPRMIHDVNLHELRIGRYRHFAHSLHAYETDVEELRRMTGAGRLDSTCV